MRALVVLALVFTSMPCIAAGPSDLCHNSEETIFGCVVGAKVAAICASSDVTATTGYVQYRYGTPERLELVYPAKLTPHKGYFYRSYTAYSGGGESKIRFSNGGYDYVLSSRMVRTNFKPGEPNDPKESSDMLVLRNGKSSFFRECSDFIATGHVMQQFGSDNSSNSVAP